MPQEAILIISEINDLVVNHKYKEALYKVNSLKQYTLSTALQLQVNKLESMLVNELSKYKQED